MKLSVSNGYKGSFKFGYVLLEFSKAFIDFKTLSQTLRLKLHNFINTFMVL